MKINERLKSKFEIQLFLSGEKKMSVKCLLVGESGAGKTTLLKKLITGVFDENCEPSEDNQMTTFEIKERKINIWDCVNSDSYANAQCAIVVYYDDDDSVDEYIKNIIKQCGNIPIITCCNKADELSDDEEEEDLYSEYVNEFYEVTDSNYREEMDISAEKGEGLLKPIKTLLKVI